MTGQDIAALIKDPARVSRVDPSELASLAEKYPYTQLFSLLYLQSLGLRNDLRFDEELLKHSYRITDRARLYRMIHDFQESETETEVLSEAGETKNAEDSPVLMQELAPEPAEEKAAEEPTNSSQFTVDSESEVEEDPAAIVPAEEAEENPEAPQHFEEVPLEPQPEAVLETAEIPKVEEQETSDEQMTDTPEEPAEKSTIQPTSDPLEQLILQYAVSTSYRLDDLTPEEAERLEQRKETVEEAPDPQQESVHPTLEIEAKQSFTSWLSTNRNATPEDKEEQKAVRSIVRDFQSFDPSDELFGEVEKPKHAFFSPARKAKESLREDDLPVSETLAKIYAMQGNYPKAIRAYEQLSLIYPEKKTFFATLIADLEQKLNLK